VGDTRVPLICMSDGTHHANFAGNMTEWPFYKTTGNISWKIHQIPSMDSIVIVALLPIAMKNSNIRPRRLYEQRQTNPAVLNEVLRHIHQPLSFKHNPGAESWDDDVLRADGSFRCSKPVLAASLPDCSAYSNQHHLEWHVSC
jgi:hypothetical protein